MHNRRYTQEELDNGCGAQFGLQAENDAGTSNNSKIPDIVTMAYGAGTRFAAAYCDKCRRLLKWFMPLYRKNPPNRMRPARKVAFMNHLAE